MRAEDIKKYLDRRPFKPFRFIMEDGRPVDVRRPEKTRLLGSTLFVARLLRDGIMIKYALYGVEWVVKIVPLPARRKRRKERTG